MHNKRKAIKSVQAQKCPESVPGSQTQKCPANYRESKVSWDTGLKVSQEKLKSVPVQNIMNANIISY